MRAVHEARAHQRGLRAKYARPNLIQRLTAQVVIAVARGPGKAGLRDAELLEGLHNALCITSRDAVYLREARGQLRLAVLREALDFRRYVTQLHRL